MQRYLKIGCLRQLGSPETFVLHNTLKNIMVKMFSFFLLSRTRHLVRIYLILLKISIDITTRMQNIHDMMKVHNPQEISQVQFRIVLCAKVCQALL